MSNLRMAVDDLRGSYALEDGDALSHFLDTYPHVAGPLDAAVGPLRRAFPDAHLELAVEDDRYGVEGTPGTVLITIGTTADPHAASHALHAFYAEWWAICHTNHCQQIKFDVGFE